MRLSRDVRHTFLNCVRANMLRMADKLEAEPNAFVKDFFKYRTEDLAAFRASGLRHATEIRATYTEDWVERELVNWYAQAFTGGRIAA